MDFVALILFLAFYYLRPQEWSPSVNSFHPIQMLSVLAIGSMVQKGKFKNLIKTPLDWLMLAYFVWTLIAGFTPLHTLSGIQSVALFYFLGVRSLENIDRQKRFLGWWCAFMFIISLLAVACTLGFDPFGSLDKTMGPMKGRLVLNLSVFNNPNALGHSIVPVVPLFYYLVFWRRMGMKAILLLLVVPLWCVYLTQSKGAFLCLFVTILATLTFGRALIWQVGILVLGAAFGYGALYSLPRMNELQNSKTDPAIQGRVAALTYGMFLMEHYTFGIGLGNFQQWFLARGPMEQIHVPRVMNHERRMVTVWHHYSKATHGAYNQNGAELGYVGLFLFVGILYCCVRTLLLVKPEDDDEERIRRALFVLVMAYAVSSWMVDFCYRPTFFMFVAAISAFHRHLIRKQSGEVEETIVDKEMAKRPWLRGLTPLGLPGVPAPALPAPAGAGGMAFYERPAKEPPPAPILPPPRVPYVRPEIARPQNRAESAAEVELDEEGKPKVSLSEKLRTKFIWTRLGVVDFIVIAGLSFAAVLYWKHLIATM